MSTEAKNGPALMAAAAAETARAVTGAAKTAPLDTKTPCPDWDLRTLLNHTILWTAYSAETYQAQIANAVHAWSDPEVWAGDRSVMGSAMPAADIAAMLIMEMVLHGWDVAKAVGQDYHCNGELAQAVLQTVQAQGDMFRQYQGFAAIVPVPDDAPAFDRALGLSGRNPSWPNIGTP